MCDVYKPEFHGKGPSPRWYAGVNEPALYFPPGVYVYKGNGLDCTNAPLWHIKGDGPNQARIEIANEVYFLTCGRIESTIFEGLSLVGGKGAFRSTWTKNMVGGRHIFRDCNFVDYSECAIGNNADDSPYLSVEDCIFYGRAKSPAIGIAWGGYFDDRPVTRCALRTEPVSHQARRPHGRESADRPPQQLHLLRRHEEGSRHLAGPQQRPE